MLRPVLYLYHQQVCVFYEATRSAIDNQVILSELKYISIFIAGDPGSISGLGSSPGEGISYPLQHSWASLVAQMVKNLLAIRETWILSLDWEDPWKRAWLPTPVFLPGESPWTEEPGDNSPWGRKESDRIEQLNTKCITKHRRSQNPWASLFQKSQIFQVKLPLTASEALLQHLR